VKLPNGDKARVDITKLRDYCLDQGHREGKHKARVFRAALGLARDDADALRTALLAAARDEDVIPAEADEYGERYMLDFLVVRGERKALIRSAWIVLKDDDFPRLTTCYVLEGA